MTLGMLIFGELLLILVYQLYVNWLHGLIRQLWNTIHPHEEYEPDFSKVVNKIREFLLEHNPTSPKSRDPQ